MKKLFWLSKVLFACLAVSGVIVLAQAVSYNLSINGKTITGKTIVVKGETYIPLKALQAAGVRSSVTGKVLALTLSSAASAGGANQTAALEGCIGEWLFNGIWRFKVNSILAFTENNRAGWDVNVELRNGSTADKITAGATGAKSVVLSFPDSNNVSLARGDIGLRQTSYNAAQGVVLDLRFYNDQKLDSQPQKLVMLVETTRTIDVFLRQKKIGYSVANPSFRIRLDCNK